MFKRKVGPYSNFLIMSLPYFGITVMLASKNELESVSSSSVLWMCLCRVNVSSLSVWYISPVKPSTSRHFFFFLVGGVLGMAAGQKFLTANSTSLTDIKLLTLSIFLVVCIFKKFLISSAFLNV